MRTDSPSRFFLGKTLMTVAAGWTGVGPFVFDWNQTHIHNPAWPPHAKFHNAQTMSMGAALALTTARVLWHETDDPRTALDTGLVTATLFWLTQFSAALYPGTASVDPPEPDSWPQLKFAAPVLTAPPAGYLLERRRLASTRW